MTTTVPTTTRPPVDRAGALRKEAAAVLRFCADLTPDEWNAPSRAAGWRVRDVVAHLSGSCRLMFTPSQMAGLLRSNQVERFNDTLVEQRQATSPSDLLSEYRTWSPRVARLFSVLRPVGSLPLRVGELGWYPARIIPSALTFDAHTHLRHDIALALDRPAPPTDDQRMTATVEWLLALLEKLNAGQRTWFDRPLLFTLTGDGGGAWRLDAAGEGRLRATIAGGGTNEAAAINGAAADFPLWSTRRTSWRESGVAFEGDDAYATRFLDTVHLV